MKKKYKALILDVDGTLIPNKFEGMPSEKVTKAIKKAKNVIHIGVATSRPLFVLSHITKRLALSGPSIINAGSQVVDVSSQKILWEKMLNNDDVKEILTIAKKLELTFILQSNQRNLEPTSKNLGKKISKFWFHALVPSILNNFTERITHIPTIAIHRLPSWKDHKIDLIITHAAATKQHAILEVAKLLKIETHEMIGVGDGYNDFPLLMACGLKIAMGNAVDELKAIADYIAPSVEEDGVADVIQKFVL